MKKILLLLFVFVTYLGNAQIGVPFKWKFDLDHNDNYYWLKTYYQKYSTKSGTQLCGLWIGNNTSHRLHIILSFEVKTWCGKIKVSSKRDVYLDPNEAYEPKYWKDDGKGLSFYVSDDECQAGSIEEVNRAVIASDDLDGVKRYNRVLGIQTNVLEIKDLDEEEAKKKAEEARAKALAKQKKDEENAIIKREQAKQQQTNATFKPTAPKIVADQTTTTSQQRQTTANTYLKAAQTQGDNPILQSMNTNLAKTNAIASGNATLANQITQQQNQQQQQNLSNALGTIANIFTQQNSQQEQREQARRESEAKKRAEDLMAQQAEMEFEERSRDFTNRNHQIFTAIQGNYNSTFKRPSEISDDKIKTIYYVAWYWKYDDNNVPDEIDENAFAKSVTIYPPIMVNKYSDDTWVLFTDLKKKIEKGLGGRANIYGYFVDKESANNAFNAFKQNAINAGRYITVVDWKENGQAPAQSIKKQTDLNFWNN